MTPQRLPTVRHLLLALNAVVLGLPVLLLFGLRVDEAELVQQTERRLIGEAVVIAEAWRGHYLEALGTDGANSPNATPQIRPTSVSTRRYVPIEPRSDIDFALDPPEAAPERTIEPGDGATWQAGARVSPLLERALVFNLSGARVLDSSGCIVGTSGDDLGQCLDAAPEVQAALRGEYAVTVRERISDEPTPPPWSMRRRGRHRVYNALPVHQDGEVIGAVRMSRTAIAPEEWLWRHRGPLLVWVGLCAVIVPAITWSLSHAISLPLRRIAKAASAVSDGEDPGPLAPRGIAPREVGQLAEALERMRETIERRADFIESFTSEVGHELKTPVTSIRGAAELLRDGWEVMEPSQRDRFLANLESDAERLEDLVRQLLALARIEHDPEPSESIDVRSFFETLCERYGEGVELSVAPDAGSLEMSRERLEAAARNLIENALRHGSGAAVQVRVERADERLRVRVADRGPGVPERLRTRIFDRFYTTAREAGGTGLGLAIVKAVADSRGGRIELESPIADGIGTAFTLTV